METFGKKEKEKNKKKKKQDKELKRQERKANSKGGSLDSMMAYLDENGNIIDAPMDLSQRVEVDADSIEIGIPKRSEEDMVDVRSNGKLIHFNSSKGYGFIKDLDTQESLFVHMSEINGVINENDKVTFEKAKGQKGWNAVKVRKA